MTTWSFPAKSITDSTAQSGIHSMIRQYQNCLMPLFMTYSPLLHP